MLHNLGKTKHYGISDLAWNSCGLQVENSDLLFELVFSLTGHNMILDFF